ncbi:MAG TPA: acetate kinase, partial [Candidatus Limnocylindrales bacterium]|nr:acetate kinase [Candidatus Limnocylindrales bacterium]
MRVLVLNAGSSSLKASVVDAGETIARTDTSWGADASRAKGREGAVAAVLEAFRRDGVAADTLAAVGHRVVHGGTRFTAPVTIDAATLDALDELSDLAPLHNPVAIDTIRAARTALPSLRHVACFDTAFHATLPETAAQYPLPEAWRAEWGIRRFGFHGLSVAWSVERAAEILSRPVAELNVVVAHLGSGCSVTAVPGGRSAWTSMGFTPLEGLMMGTRSGSIDPGILLHLLRTRKASRDEIEDALEHGSGLAGVSGIGSDIRELEPAAAAGDTRARLALDMFADRAAAGIAGAMTSVDR